MDEYFFVSPDRMNRIRRLDISFPEKGVIFSYTEKQGKQNEYEEYDHRLSEREYDMVREILDEQNLPVMVVVSGDRKQYFYDGLTICNDHVENLEQHEWTEAEKLVRSRREIKPALLDEYKFFSDHGISRDYIREETYAQMMLKQIGTTPPLSGLELPSYRMLISQISSRGISSIPSQL
ncbi:hypothetical protein HY501_03360 [Candidatus Woesearchaeota archaeon]|nr:hypothetical protein [Candidatus Woesearchaeota archaeon]